MNDKKSKGDFGEDTACKYIKKNGYKILAKISEPNLVKSI